MKKVGGFIATAFAVKEVINFTKTAVKAASETQAAWTGLNSIVNGTGKSFKAAQNFITDYTRDGLVSVNEAVTAYKNLLSRGYDTSQIEGTMKALKDSASFGRQASYGLGEAVVTATEGLKNENSILVDNAGVTKNVAKMWDEYARSIGKTSNNLTQAEKIQAEYKGILKETKFQVGDAITYANTFSGQIQRLKASFTSLKVAVGKVVTPIAQLFIPVINGAVTALTNLFNGISKVLSAFGLKFQEVVGKNNNSVTNFTNGINETGDAAVKAAKKVNKAFANVDEINVITPTKNSSSNGSGGTGVESTNFNISGDAFESTTSISKLIDKLKELGSLFKDGFKDSFGNTNFDSIIDSVNNIKKAIKEIFNDSEVKKSANDWSKTILFSLGQIVGGISRIGVNIGSALVGSFEKYIEKNSGRIKKFLIKMFNVTSKDFTLTGEFTKALGKISDVFNSSTAKQIGANIIAMFVNPLMSVIEFVTKFVSDLKAVFMQPIIDNVDKIKVALENTLAPLQTITDTISTAFTYFGDKLNEVYDNSIGPLLESIKNGLSDTFSKFLDVYNEHIAPFIERFSQGVKSLWEEHLRPFVDKLAGFITSLINAIQVLWEKWLKPLIDWIIQNVIPKLVPVFEGIWNTTKTVFGNIVDAIGGVVDFLKGLIDFVVGVFTGNWNKAWEGIKTAFSGIWNAIKGIVGTVISAIGGVVSNGFNTIKSTISTAMNGIKTIISNVWNGIWDVIKNIINSILGGIQSMVNGVIKGFNTMINALNKLKFEVPDWVPPPIGGKKFGFNLKTINEVTIPRLYKGGYVESNNPQLAIIGDNTREGEIVTPESKIYEQVDKAIKNNNGVGKQEIEITIYHKYEDGKTIIQKVNQAQIDAGEILLLT